MTMRVDGAVLNATCNAAVDLIDEGTGDNGTIEFYTGSPPATLNDAPAGDLLAEVDFAGTAFGDAGAGALDDGVAQAADLPLETTGDEDGTIGFARILDADGDVVWDETDVGTSDAAIVVNTLTVSTGVDFRVTEYLFSVVPQSS